MKRIIQRRAFLMLVGGAATLLLRPRIVRAQKSAMPVVGFLRSSSNDDAADLLTAFRRGLKEQGFVEGQNVAIDIRSAEGHQDRLPALAADLMNRPVAVFVGNTPAARAAKAASATLPIVFMTGFDPVKLGLVKSLNRPGANVTGVFFFGSELEGKQLELLHQVVPKVRKIGVLVYPNGSNPTATRKAVQTAAQTIGLQALMLDVSSPDDIDNSFAALSQQGAGAVLAAGDAFFTSNRARIVALAARHAMPAIYDLREFVQDGGLMSYAPSITDAFRQVGVYAGRILKGEKPADLPVMQSTKFEFVLNLKTAKTLGLDIPPTLLALADEVIE